MIQGAVCTAEGKHGRSGWPSMNTKRVYRICRRCGKEWNVSRLDPGEKVYICPVCDYRARLAAKSVKRAEGIKA